ncbi:MAG: ribbon-helix-helix domain-containing protein [Methanosarcinaceae archaeon]|nr:ribbon-helix-helix domain-containing protein [Methanosarcinaceae archaeon]
MHMNESKETKIKFGISIDKELVQKIDAIVEQSDYLKISRSELIETILEKFMFEHIDKKELAINAVGLVIRSRKGELLV